MTFLKDKRRVGIFLSILLTVVFVAVSLSVNKMIQGVPWFIFSSLLRLAFGILILYIVKKLYDKDSKELLSFKNSKETFVAAAGFLIFFIYYVVLYCIGAKSVSGLTMGIIFSRIILQQLMTGFYEEMHYRVLMCEGYRFTKGGFTKKLIYALISTVLFGAIHIITGWNTYTFLQTSVIGFAFAVIYLNSGNILLPMILHFVYDIFANLAGFVEWSKSDIFISLNSVYNIFLTVMFAVSFIMLTRKASKTDLSQ